MRVMSYPTGSVEPVSLAAARVACRFDPDTQVDAQVAGLIESAREQAEHITGRVFRLQVLREVLAAWWTGSLQLPVDNATAAVIAYRSAASPDTFTTLDPAVYRWGSVGGMTVVRLRPGLAWPELASDDYPDRVRVDLTATPIGQMPQAVRTFILACVAGWMDQPGALVDGRLQVNPLHLRLLDREILWR
jgi:hypothetical protein